jgi:hypothetical protein
MKSVTLLALLLCVIALACGGETLQAADGLPVDANVSDTVLDGQDADTTPETATTFDAAGRMTGDSNPPCSSDLDCEGNLRCVSGLCCGGQVVDGKCVCGAGAGCDLNSYCCVHAGQTIPACWFSDVLCNVH